ncbi:Hypothetical protein NocV09_01701260 [Nannochloropsis oceanica]
MTPISSSGKATRDTGNTKTKTTRTKNSSSTSQPHPSPPAVALTSGIDVDDDDDAPEEMKSKVVRDDDQRQESNAAATSSSKSKSKKRPRKAKAREELYWAEKKGKRERGEEAEEEDEEEKEGEEGLAIVAAEGESDEKVAGRVSKKSKVTSSAGAGPLSADYLESVQLAKQAEQRRRIHEALRVIESARRKAEAAERQKPKALKAPRVFGNIHVATLGAVQQQADEAPDVPPEVLAFARSLGESSGKATQRKRVPFVAFSKSKPKMLATASVRRGRAGKGKVGSGKK